MASSSNSNAINNLRVENINCRHCGRRARILVSSSLKNPGRLYYGCIDHGWLKWAMVEGNNGDRFSRSGMEYTFPNSQGSFHEEDARNGIKQQWNCFCIDAGTSELEFGIVCRLSFGFSCSVVS